MEFRTAMPAMALIMMAYYKLDADGVYGGIKEFLKNEEGNK